MSRFLSMALGGLVLLPCLRAQSPPPDAAPVSTAPPPPALSAPQGKVSPPKAVDIANEPTVKVVANVMPAVVNINAPKTSPQYVTYFDNYFHQFRNGIINRTEMSIGSGLIVSADGYVITNAHVVALADREKPVNITLNTGSKYQARIVYADEDADLALLKIDDKGQFPYFDLTFTSPNHLGQTVIALGSPAGYQNSVSQGILSALHRSFTAGEHTYNNLIQTDAAINPGNSGGPLVDLNGGLVGINSAKLSGAAIESIGFTIPNDIVVPWANDAMAVARGLKPPPPLSTLDIVRDRLGLSVKTLTAKKAESLNLTLAGGLLITRVDNGSPADNAQLKEGMIIVAIGNKQVTDEKSLPRELQNIQPGSKVRVQVIFFQNVGMITIQRGGAAELTAR